MLLFVIFALSTVILFAVFWGGSLVAQGYLYQQPASRLPLRAAIAALLAGGFTAAWVAIDKKNPGKYDTFFSFYGETTRDFDEFEAVRWTFDPAAKALKSDAQGKPIETAVKFKKSGGGKAARFLEAGANKKFLLNDTSMMTAALLVPAENGPIRFNAQFVKDNRGGIPNYTKEGRFVEEKGDRYVPMSQVGVMYIPSGGVIATALFLNFLLFAVWMIAFWPVLRFSWGHAFGFTAAFGFAMLLLVLPLLFGMARKTGA
ncbi:MAG TPA: hypothetical protein VN641_02790 [Urbifossiella sp.]|nr:hypothetical protein [Urbifossiella sp.]